MLKKPKQNNMAIYYIKNGYQWLTFQNVHNTRPESIAEKFIRVSNICFKNT